MPAPVVHPLHSPIRVAGSFRLDTNQGGSMLGRRGVSNCLGGVP